MKLVLQKVSRHWWIVGYPPEDGPVGPYDTHSEAEEDLKGLKRFERNQDKPGFVTSEKRNEN